MDYLFLGGAAIAGLLAVVLVHQWRRRHAAEQELADLRASEQRFKELVEQATDIICRTDASGRFTFVNPTLAPLLDRSESGLLQDFAGQYVRAAWFDKAADFYREQLASGAAHAYLELPLNAPD